MRRRPLLAVGLLLLTAGCTGGSVTAGDITVERTADADCDGQLGSVTLQAAARYEGSGDLLSEPDPYAVIAYRRDGAWVTLRRFDDVAGGEVVRSVTVTSGDLGGVSGTVRFRLTLYDADVTADQRFGSVRSDVITIESGDADSVQLQPTFTWSPMRPAPGQQVTFVGNETSKTECAITYRWDFDRDGAFEARGRTVVHRFDRDGYRQVRLSVIDSRGTTANVTRELLVFLDPDGDGVTSAVETRRGIDPADPDTDDDLFGDGVDPLPAHAVVPTLLLQVLLTAAIGGVTVLGADRL